MSEVPLYTLCRSGCRQTLCTSKPTRRTRNRKVDVRLPGKGNSNSRGTRPVHLNITMTKWIRTRRLPIKNSLSVYFEADEKNPVPSFFLFITLKPRVE